ncbi:MAG: CDP-alcohol phosphatidyltransferase family protein, partial [Candidatus Micrarchaeaceae archaeon]
MRSADAATLLRVALVVAVVWLVLQKFNALAIAIIFVAATALDGVDGFLAVRQESKGTVSFFRYLRSSLGNKSAREEIKAYKSKVSLSAKFGPRIDIAGDRFAEYSLLILFACLAIVPLFLVLAIVLVHSFADALMGSKGTSSKMKSQFASIVYTSNVSRASINIAKIITFSYLIFEYVDNYPAIIGQIFLGIMSAIIFARGA